MRSQRLQADKLFSQLLVLTLVFMLMQISFFIQCLHYYFDDFNFIAHKLEIPYAILPGILWFVFAQILVHAGALLLVFAVAVALASFFKLSAKAGENLGLLIWLMGLLTIFFSNQLLFPNSRFSYLLRYIVPDTLAGILLVFLCCFWLFALALTAYVALKKCRWRGRAAILVGILFWGGYYLDQHYAYQNLDAASEARPNIIIVGVDSLRPDFLAFFGAALKTPFLDSFLQQATVFSNAFTPLARTFPSWVGILSGAYPKESGVRYNLAQQSLQPPVTLLSTLLHQQGYKTIYATDETRFSNIDQAFGFDEVLSPPIGLNDFLLGSFNDFPLSNLVVNTPLGPWLFPHSYASRPVYVTYDPDSFLNRLKPYLRKRRQQPLFLAVHFCLPHAPYIWGAYPGYTDKSPVSRYQAAISRIDRQLSDFMGLLKHDQILQHALVVLLSDHGEALELTGDRITSLHGFISGSRSRFRKIPRFYPPSADQETVEQSAGHGTDVLGFSQYHSLLAFKLFGLNGQAVKKISHPVLLLDIKPTVLDFLKLKNKNSGLSLRNLILGKGSSLAPRPIFLESDFSPEAIHSVHPETRALIFEGIELFKIDPKTTRISVKDSMGKLILSSKQYALVENDWVLALYPQDQGKMLPVLVHLSTGQWTTDLRLSFAQKSPLKHMLAALKQFYGSELKQLSP